MYQLKTLDNGCPTVTCVCTHSLGTELIMQSEVYSDKEQLMVVASVGRECHLYDVTAATAKVEELGSMEDETDSLSTRNNTVGGVKEEAVVGGAKEEAVSDSGCGNSYSIEKSACVTTDEATKDSCQNVARFFKQGSRVITAGEDRNIRVWNVS